MAEDIVPALEKLRKEKGQYMEWQATNANLDRQRRFCVALTWEEKRKCAPPCIEHKKGAKASAAASQMAPLN